MITTVRHVIVSFFYGTIYFQLATGTDPADYSNRMALFFFSLLFAVVGHQQCIPGLQEDRLMFYRERGSKAYGALSYWVSCWILQIPLAIFNILVFSMILYTCSGLRPGGGYFFYFYFMTLMCSFNGLFICQLLSAISSSTPAALQLFPMMFFFILAFSGLNNILYMFMLIYLTIKFSIVLRIHHFPPWFSCLAGFLGSVPVLLALWLPGSCVKRVLQQLGITDGRKLHW